MTTQTICVSSGDASHSHLIGLYTLEHESEIGLKYVLGDVKITYSDRITNFAGGQWRWAKNSSPYTLYYANSATGDTVPTDDWINIEESLFTGNVDTSSDCSSQVTPTPTPSSGAIPTPTPSVTPTVTPTPTNSETLADVVDVIRNDLTELVQVRGKPTITHIGREEIPTNTECDILLTGYSLHYTTSVHLSSNEPNISYDLIDKYDDPEFPAFRGIPISFTILSENELQISVPAMSAECDIDIIISNIAGYGTLGPQYGNNQEWTDYNLQHTLIHVVSGL